MLFPLFVVYYIVNIKGKTVLSPKIDKGSKKMKFEDFEKLIRSYDSQETVLVVEVNNLEEHDVLATSFGNATADGLSHNMFFSMFGIGNKEEDDFSFGGNCERDFFKKYFETYSEDGDFHSFVENDEKGEIYSKTKAGRYFRYINF